MRDCVREICILSIFCGAVISLCPECGVKKILCVLETVVLMANILNAFRNMDMSVYSVQLARFHEREKELLQEADDIRDRLDRLVIEDEYASYVERKAETAGVFPDEVVIQARWSKEGLWIPASSRICIRTEKEREQLSRILEGELGIPAERQEWVLDE